MRIARTLNILLAIGWLATAFSPPALAATVEELLAKINKLPAADRQKRLEEGAKKEGKLTVFSNQGISTIRAYVKGYARNTPSSKSNPPASKGPEGWTGSSWNTAWESLRPTS